MVHSQETAAGYLRSSSLFRSVSEADLAGLTPPPEMISLAAGEVLMRQGDLDSDYYHLVNGQLRIFVQGADGRRVPVAHVNPGEGVGEMSLLTGDPRSATVVARLDSKLVRVRQATLLQLIELHPRAAIEIARVVIHRLGRKPAPATYKRIAVLPLQQDVDSRQLAEALTAELGKFGKSCVLESRSQSPEHHDELPGVSFAVYDGGHEPNAWSRHCLLLADLVLFVTRAGVSVQNELAGHMGVVAEIDRQVLGRVDLLILHPGEWMRTNNTAAWIRKVSPREHHHLRLGNGADMARLARIVAGRAVNVVLSGGGARSFAQFGALRALRERGIPIDRVGGSSMGAFVGAVYAYDGDFSALTENAKKSFRKRRPAWDFTLPLHSILRGNRLQQVSIDVCGEWRIEDLPTTFFCLSADLSDAEIVTHVDGSVCTALRSSGAMPVIGPPLLREGKILIDGGALNNLPVDVMRERFSGAIIAINVSSDEAMRMDSRWELKNPSGFEILRNKINPFAKRAEIPDIFEILYRTLILSTQSRILRTRKEADWLIEPPVAGYGVVDFNAFDKLAELGYRHTMKLLEEKRAEADPAGSGILDGFF